MRSREGEIALLKGKLREVEEAYAKVKEMQKDVEQELVVVKAKYSKLEAHYENVHEQKVVAERSSEVAKQEAEDLRGSLRGNQQEIERFRTELAASRKKGADLARKEDTDDTTADMEEAVRKLRTQVEIILWFLSSYYGVYTYEAASACSVNIQYLYSVNIFEVPKNQ